MPAEVAWRRNAAIASDSEACESKTLSSLVIRRISADALGDLAQLEIAASRSRPVQQPHEHTRAAAIDVVDLANVEYDERLVGEYATDVLLQGLGLLTRNDPSSARHDGDVANAAGLQRQRHNASSLFDGRGIVHQPRRRRNEDVLAVGPTAGGLGYGLGL